MLRQATSWTLDFVVADAQGQMARLGVVGAAAAQCERRKKAKYRDACASTPSTSLIPVRVETFGGVGHGAQRFVKTLLRLRSARLPYLEQDEYEETRVGHYYIQRLVVALLRLRHTSSVGGLCGVART